MRTRMQYRSYDAEKIEPAIREFWDSIDISDRYTDSDAEPYYFLDGPPYTSGQVHVGTAWNKAMKDLVVRYKRMQGYDVFDRAGYDMHGLPNEHATMKELGLENNEDIMEYGLAEFIKACEERGSKNLKAMNKDFERMGISLNFADAYQTMSEQWMQSVWWLIKQAHENGRLYEGLRPMAWDPATESACAKHELEYKQVEDESIYVKFRRADADEYLLVWTTTPWTIPFNLMIMVNPELTYQRVQVDDEVWIVAKELREEVLEAADSKGEILEELSGEELIGIEYEHFFADELDYQTLKQQHPNIHTVVASKEYVTTEAGTGLVHAAPGCGPEDYEVGVENDVPAWNLLDSKGRYPQDTGRFSGVRAREEDEVFTQAIQEHGALAAKQAYVHDYPHAERSKAAVVYKATKQWFFKVDDIKEQMIAQNDEVNWVPEAGYNAFNSWLENLRDNSITKQRFWGTPFPVWRSEAGDVIVVESKQELEALSGEEIPDLHKPWIDEVTITKDGEEYTRIPDVVDVWLDAGAAHFAALGHPGEQSQLERYWPADFIIEGNDQVRGWFNLLMVTSTLAFGEAPFKNVYMHGMINDTSGRKMSKSEGNYITPDEIIDKYGADASRLYLISASRAGLDLNYNHADCENKAKSLLVYWNIHNYLLELINTAGHAPRQLSEEALGVEEHYILSRTHHALKRAQGAMEEYQLELLPRIAEELLDDISRTYIQLVRTKATSGEEEERRAVISTLAHCFSAALKLLAPVTPFISEAMWQNLREPFGLKEESIHLSTLPNHEEKRIDEELEDEIDAANRLISVLLSARDRAQIGVRWPLKEARITSAQQPRAVVEALVREQTNIKELTYEEALPLELRVAPDYRRIGKEYGEQTAQIADAINNDPEGLGEELAKNGSISVAGEELSEEYLEVGRTAPEGWVLGTDEELQVLISTESDDELEREGYFRELVRRVQQARKDADMEKTDDIALVLSEELTDVVKGHEQELSRIVGASTVEFGDHQRQPHVVQEAVKERELAFGFAHRD